MRDPRPSDHAVKFLASIEGRGGLMMMTLSRLQGVCKEAENAATPHRIPDFAAIRRDAVDSDPVVHGVMTVEEDTDTFSAANVQLGTGTKLRFHESHRSRPRFLGRQSARQRLKKRGATVATMAPKSGGKIEVIRLREAETD